MSNYLDNLKHEFECIGAALQAVENRVSALRKNVSVDTIDATTALDRAKLYYRKRRDREQMFGNSDLFADPAWDILIDLFIAREEGNQISVSSACIAAAVPGTTALRWINVLESRGHVIRFNDPHDARRVYLTLTPTTAERVRTYFDTL